MTADEVKGLFRRLSVWRSGEERAPHKPLLLLLALGHVRGAQERWLRYADVDRSLSDLLIAFGPPRRVNHPEYPFWRLQNDGLWEIPDRPQITVAASGNVSRVSLLRLNVRGGFPDRVFRLLCDQPEVIGELAAELVEGHFPESLHADVLSAVGLDHPFDLRPAQSRDPKFRELVLRTYEYRCAICGYHVRLGNSLVGLDAAHIRWHQAGGPCTCDNGLALCALHHKLFDRGAFTLSRENRVLVSQDAHGFEGIAEILLKYHGHMPRPPQNAADEPAQTHVGWHRTQVFRRPGREFPG